MKKVMLLAAMLAVVLAAAAPAFAQATAGNITAQYVNCSQVQNAVAGQYGTAAGGTANASGAASAVNNSAMIAQQLGINQAQINGCLGGVAIHFPGTVLAGPSGTLVTVSGAPISSASASATSSAAPSVVTTLPSTGGVSLIAIGAGVLLVGGGLVARRLIR